MTLKTGFLSTVHYCTVQEVEIGAFIEKKVLRRREFSWDEGKRGITITTQQDQILPLPWIHRRRKVKLLRIKGILARVHFCEIPLRSGVELRRTQMQQLLQSVMCSYLRQRAELRTELLNQSMQFYPPHQLWVQGDRNEVSATLHFVSNFHWYMVVYQFLLVYHHSV